MKKIGILCIILGGMFLAFQYIYLPFSSPKKTQSVVNRAPLKTMMIGPNQLEVEVVSTPEKITRGLSGRDAIGSHGMLFVMPTKTKPSFWMKDMRISLDFIWIDGNTVVDVMEEVPPPYSDVPDSQLQVYQPKVPVTHVLEVAAGSIHQWQVEIGDPVVIN